MSTELDALARAVQDHIPEQPWSRRGNDPLPVQIEYDAHAAPGLAPWWVRFVVAVKPGGAPEGKRAWATVRGDTLSAALTAARAAQRAARPTLMDTLGGGPDA